MADEKIDNPFFCNDDSRFLSRKKNMYDRLLGEWKEHGTYRWAIRYLLLSMLASGKQRSKYEEMARTFLEMSLGYEPISSVVLSTYFGGFPPCSVRVTAFEEIRKYIEIKM